jgi:hypothetical protein
MVELRTVLTIDDYFSAWQYLQKKAETQQQMAEQAKTQQQIAQMNRRGGLG